MFISTKSKNKLKYKYYNSGSGVITMCKQLKAQRFSIQNILSKLTINIYFHNDFYTSIVITTLIWISKDCLITSCTDLGRKKVILGTAFGWIYMLILTVMTLTYILGSKHVSDKCTCDQKQKEKIEEIEIIERDS